MNKSIGIVLIAIAIIETVTIVTVETNYKKAQDKVAQDQILIQQLSTVDFPQYIYTPNIGLILPNDNLTNNNEIISQDFRDIDSQITKLTNRLDKIDHKKVFSSEMNSTCFNSDTVHVNSGDSVVTERRQSDALETKR